MCSQETNAFYIIMQLSSFIQHFCKSRFNCDDIALHFAERGQCLHHPSNIIIIVPGCLFHVDPTHCCLVELSQSGVACTTVATSVHIFQQTFMSAVFLVSLAESVGERSRVETVGGKILLCYTVGLVGSKYTVMSETSLIELGQDPSLGFSLPPP